MVSKFWIAKLPVATVPTKVDDVRLRINKIRQRIAIKVKPRVKILSFIFLQKHMKVQELAWHYQPYWFHFLFLCLTNGGINSVE